MALQQGTNQGLRELSLFAGAGGGILGGKLLGWRTVCAVEINAFCARRLMQRQNEEHLSPFPIWDDVRTFDGRPWQGLVDVVSGGFPCQPFSRAGNQKAENDPRNMWPEAKRIISEVKPPKVLLENVPGISKYLRVVIRDLRRIGYTVKRPLLVSGAAVGAGHIRERVWVYAYFDTEGLENSQGESAEKTQAYERAPFGVGNGEKISAYFNSEWKLQQKRGIKKQRERVGNCNWWKAEPDLVRVVYGVPNGMDRIGALGNAQIPIVAALAWEILSGD